MTAWLRGTGTADAGTSERADGFIGTAAPYRSAAERGRKPSASGIRRDLLVPVPKLKTPSLKNNPLKISIWQMTILRLVMHSGEKIMK